MNETEIDIEHQPVGNAFARAIDRILEPQILGPVIGTIAVAIALFVIHEISGKIHLNHIGEAIAATSAETVIPALFFTMISFGALALYDVLAVRRIAPGRVPAKIAVMAGMVGYGFSNAIGFHVFVGGPVRYRIYQAAGLDASDVGRIVGTSLITFTGGLLTVLGVALLLDPTGVPALQMLTPVADRVLGGAILAFLAICLFWLSRGLHNVSLLGWRFPLPSAGSALAQILIGALDIAAAAAALYILLPSDVVPSFVVFLVLFVAAILATIISHAPGGLGVMEATILLGLGAGARPDVVAALVVYRIIYYLLPLSLSAIALLTFETYRARSTVSTLAGRTFRLTRRIVPPIATTLVLGGGMVLLFSGSTPAIGDRTDILSDILPLPFAEASHLLASITGVLLIVIARGLFRRLALARIAAIVLLLSGAAFSLLKGLDWEEALILSAVAAILYAYRSAFYRKGDWRSFRPDITWLALMAIVVGAFTLVGFLAYRHVEYQSDMWWDFAWDADAPRFMRATVAIAIVAAAIAVDALMHRPAPAPKNITQPVPDAVRTVLETSAGTNGCVALLGDKSFMVSPNGTAFLMYAVSGRSWITMGDPVGDPGPSRGLLWRFVEAADRAGARPVFYSVQPEYLTTYLDMNLAILKIGENARIPLTDFSLAGAARQPLRYAEGRATREGLVYSVIPKADVPAALPELRAVSDEWLEQKQGKEKGFSLGYFDDAYMSEFDCAVLKKDDKIVAFANLWRSGDHDEFSVDLMRYKSGTSKVLMEAFFAHLLLYGRDEGYKWFNLGAAPLAGLSDHPLASTWNRVGTFIYKRGDEFYNFEGLRAFKQKFDPVWTPQYMACPRGLAMPQVLLDVTTLISGGPMGIFKR
ncbi:MULTISPECIES: bifunctional lysylphosphatidylglycerol flippase/synthetase MprF [Mesorhizobium]|uniref:Phosphatidylglycerol lysyltransferase n=1 Tax=Mesorhizobium denitrificans TaxID=2294114 RepID=A0A371XHT5_9HYPH|nr:MULTISPECIES: bifunctional lysylphosphatidylglycerol flippase/synthetase MprF [Mesorhizobium]RFC68781.1 bifunctional lysylphosphatidylglycerol flippase/synthetase MprF [Mesorhizobium denitrificans]